MLNVNQKKLLTLLLLFLSLIVFAYAWIYYPLREGHSGDFINLLKGGPCYEAYWHGKGISVYGPIFTFMDDAIDRFQLNRPIVFHTLFIAYLIMTLLASFLLFKMFHFWEATWLKRSVAIFLIVNYFPTVQAIRQNLIENIQFFAVVLFIFFYAGRNKRAGIAAGISLGIGIGAKTLPIVLVPYLLIRRHYKIAAVALTVFLSSVAVVARLKGVTFLNGLTSVFFFNNKEILLEHPPLDQTIGGFVLRLFARVDYSASQLQWVSFLSPRQVQPFQATLILALIVLTALVAWLVLIPFLKTSRLEKRELIYLELSILLTFLLLILPHTHPYYYGLILPGYFFLLDYFSGKPEARFKQALLILSYVLVGFRLPLRLLNLIFLPSTVCPYIQWTDVWNLRFYGVAVLLFLLIHEYRSLCLHEKRL